MGVAKSNKSFEIILKDMYPPQGWLSTPAKC